MQLPHLIEYELFLALGDERILERSKRRGWPCVEEYQRRVHVDRVEQRPGACQVDRQFTAQESKRA